MTDFKSVREQFPALNQTVYGQPLCYLDSAATALKPQAVIDRVNHFLSLEAANVHRGAHYLSDRATANYEAVREKFAEYLGAPSAGLIFTKGTTDSINLVAQSLAQGIFKVGDEILLTQLEHHSNIVPWHNLAMQRNGKVHFAKITASGQVDLEDFEKHLKTGRIRIAAFTACSNTLGIFTPVSQMIELCQRYGALSLVDGAQLMANERIHLTNLGCDFFAFSGHKIFAPYGIGVLYGRSEVLSRMPPATFGGSQISEVTEEKTTFLPPPQRFEPGTPNVEGVLGMGAALDFFQNIPLTDIQAHEKTLLKKLISLLAEFKNIETYGSLELPHAPIVSFNFKGVHASDVGFILDQQGIAVRCGHHCTQPLMRALGVPATVRASLSIYNNEQDLIQLQQGLEKAQELLFGNTNTVR